MMKIESAVRNASPYPGGPDGFVTMSCSMDGLRDAGAKIGQVVEVLQPDQDAPSTNAEWLLRAALFVRRYGIEVSAVDLNSYRAGQPEIVTDLSGIIEAGFRNTVKVDRNQYGAMLTTTARGGDMTLKAFVTAEEVGKALEAGVITELEPEPVAVAK